MFRSDSQTFDSLRSLWGLAQGEPAKPILIWVGAGASSWLGYERWSALATRFHRHFLRTHSSYPKEAAARALDNSDYPKVFQFCRDVDSRQFYSMLVDSFPAHAPSAIHRRLTSAILSIPNCSIVTTNVDEALEHSLGTFQLVQRSDLERTGTLLGTRTPFIAKLHGSISAVSSTIFTTSDYDAIRVDRSFLSALRHLLTSCSVVFLGYGLRDAYLVRLLEENHDERSLFGDGPHFLVTSEFREGLPENVKIIQYQNDLQTDHRSSLLAVELLSRPSEEAQPLFLETGSATCPRSAHFLSDFYPAGTWTTGQTIRMTNPDGDEFEMKIGPDWSNSELAHNGSTAAYDLAVGLVCFDHVIAPIDTMARLHDLIGERLFWRLVKDSVFQFVHWEGYDVVVMPHDSAAGTLATGRIASRADPMAIVSSQIKAVLGKELEYAQLMSAVERQIHLVDLSKSEKNFGNLCAGLFISPSTRVMLGISEATPAGTIPRWVAGPALRIAQIARVGATCQQLGFASMKLMSGAAPIAQAAFSAISGGVLAGHVASYALTGEFSAIPEDAFHKVPEVWDSIIRFRDLNEGVALRSSVMRYLESNAGAEIAVALDAGLRASLPVRVLEQSRTAMSALLTADRITLPTTAIWSDRSRLWDGQGAWRKATGERFGVYLKEKNLGPYDLCPCGSFEKVKHCCRAALE